MDAARPILEVRGLEKRIHSGTHEVEILRGLDFSAPAGQFLAIRGPSGSGKSTLLGLLAGLDSPSAGSSSPRAYAVSRGSFASIVIVLTSRGWGRAVRPSPAAHESP